MLSSLKKLMQQLKAEPASNVTQSHSEDLLTAALMVEVMQSDQKLDPREEEALMAVLGEVLGLNEEEAAALRVLAHTTAENATSLYEFTSQVNESFDTASKHSLIKNMWRIAYADGEIDKYEDGVIRRVAELIYVSHSDFIRMKLQAREASSV